VVLEFKRLGSNILIAQKLVTPLRLEVMRKLEVTCDDIIVGLHNRLLLQLDPESMRCHSKICALKFDD